MPTRQATVAAAARHGQPLWRLQHGMPRWRLQHGMAGPSGGCSKEGMAGPSGGCSKEGMAFSDGCGTGRRSTSTVSAAISGSCPTSATRSVATSLR